jgi:hypothetical protein
MPGHINDSLRFGWVGNLGVVPAKAGTHNHRELLSKEGLYRRASK